VIGLGRMGAAIARRFTAQGAPVTGWTRSGRSVAGVPSARDLAALVAASDVLVTSLYDDAAVAEVLDALLDCDLAGKLVVETSTVVPGVVQARADRVTVAGAAIVDAPISGGPDLVAVGQCGIFIGGQDADAARAEAALAPLSARIFHVGPLGAGLVMKTINNAMIQVYIAGLAEQLRLAGRAGLPLKTALTILGGGPAGMSAMRDRIPKMLGEDDTVGFPVSGLLKDHAVFRRVAGEAGVETPALAAAEPLFLDAIEAGLAEVDGAAILARAYRDDA